MKIEIHVHTRYSKDSMMPFWAIYLKCIVSGIDAIAITDHNNIDGAIEFKRFCEKRKRKIQVIIGEEIFSSQGEIIGLYLSDYIKPGLSASETIKKIKDQNGVVCVPHPYDIKRQKTVLEDTAIAENREFIDCVEVHNGRNISLDYDAQQQCIANKYGLTPIVGSDAHTIIELGRNYIEVTMLPLTPKDFKNTITDAELRCRPCIRMAHHITKIVKSLKLLRRGNYNELYRTIIRRIKKDFN